MFQANLTLKNVLFDLDGTLLDTAPDLAFALNTLLEKNHRPTLPFEIIRPQAGHGGKGLIQLGFAIEESHSEFYSLWQELLNLYGDHSADQTCLFPGIPEVLDYLNKEQLPWGIVTNKPGWLTEPLLKKLNLFDQPACIISGDTLSKRKPDPEPLWHACELLQCTPSESIYIGDAERDIQAAKRAGIRSVAALYGYITEADKPATWMADEIIHTPQELISVLKKI